MHPGDSRRRPLGAARRAFTQGMREQWRGGEEDEGDMPLLASYGKRQAKDLDYNQPIEDQVADERLITHRLTKATSAAEILRILKGALANPKFGPIGATAAITRLVKWKSTIMPSDKESPVIAALARKIYDIVSGGSINADCCAMMFWAVTRLHQRMNRLSGLLPLLIEIMPSKTAEMPAKQLTTVMWACATLRLRRDDLEVLMPALTGSLIDKVGELGMNEVSSIISSAVKLQGEAPDLLNLLPALGEMVQTRAHELDHMGVANAIWAIARLGGQPPELMRSLPILAELALDRADGFAAPQLSIVTWSAAKLKDQSPELLSVMPVIIERVVLRAKDLRAQNLANVLWATAKLRVEVPELRGCLPTLLEEIRRQPGEMGVQDVANIIWALGTLQVDIRDDLTANALWNMNRRATFLIRDFKVGEISQTCWGFGLLGWRDEIFMKAAAGVVLSRKLQTTDLKNDIPRIIGAFAKLGIPQAPLLRAVADMGRNAVDQLSDWSLSILSWSYTRLDAELECAGFQQSLVRELDNRGLTFEDVERSTLGPEEWRRTPDGLILSSGSAAVAKQAGPGKAEAEAEAEAETAPPGLAATGRLSLLDDEADVAE